MEDLYLLISERKLTQIYFPVNEKLLIWILDCFVHIPQVQIDCMTFKKKRKIMTCLLHING